MTVVADSSQLPTVELIDSTPDLPGLDQHALRILDRDDVYRGWSHPDPQHYWRDRNLIMVDHDEQLRWQKHKIC